MTKMGKSAVRNMRVFFELRGLKNNHLEAVFPTWRGAKDYADLLGREFGTKFKIVRVRNR